MTGTRPRKAWVLRLEGWTLFLRRLDEDSEKAGQKYEALRSRLITMFRCRGLLDPAGLTDEAIDRIVKGLEREEIQDIFAYAAGVARHVASEAFRRPSPVSLAEVQEPRQKQSFDDSQEAETDRRLDCLKDCINTLNESDRYLISNWYEHEKAKKWRTSGDWLRAWVFPSRPYVCGLFAFGNASEHAFSNLWLRGT
jgi:hypothetical protein